MNVAYGVRSDKRDESCKMVACVKDASVNKPKTHHPCPCQPLPRVLPTLKIPKIGRDPGTVPNLYNNW